MTTCTKLFSVLTLAGALMAAIPLTARAQATDQDLIGTWTVIGSSGSAGTKLEIAKPASSRTVACFLTVAGGAREECTIRRTGSGFAINAQGSPSSDMAPPSNHVLLGQVSGGLIEGKLLPSKEALKLYKEGSSEAARQRDTVDQEARRQTEEKERAAAEQRARQEAADRARRENEAAVDRRRQSTLQRLAGEWKFNFSHDYGSRTYYGNEFVTYSEGTVTIGLDGKGTAQINSVTKRHKITNSYSGEVQAVIMPDGSPLIKFPYFGMTLSPRDSSYTDFHGERRYGNNRYGNHVELMDFTKTSGHAASSLEPTQGASPTRCSLVPTLRSKEAVDATTITFVNSTGNPVATYWINYEGKPQKYVDLSPGYQIVQPTFVSHPWMVADPSGNCLGVYFPEKTSPLIRVGS